ncbi:hypothetical protein TNCV_1382351 [Trichonephila clavipes]|nr:hypothetical protein TNCV_1382351 [Trichonephila clavipes]
MLSSKWSSVCGLSRQTNDFLHSPTENSLAVLNHKILEANSQVQNVAAVAEWYRHRIVAGFVTSSSPVPLKTRRGRAAMHVKSVELKCPPVGVVW